VLFHYTSAIALESILRDGRIRVDMPPNPILTKAHPDPGVFFTTSEYWVPEWPSVWPDARIGVAPSVAKYQREATTMTEYITDEDVPESQFLAVEVWAGREFVSHSEWPARSGRPFLQRDMLWCALSKHQLTRSLYEGVISTDWDREVRLPALPRGGHPAIWLCTRRGWIPPDQSGRLFRIGVATGNVDTYSWDDYRSVSGHNQPTLRSLKALLERNYGPDTACWRAGSHPIPEGVWFGVQEWNGNTWVRSKEWRPIDEGYRLIGHGNETHQTLALRLRAVHHLRRPALL
jgi:hypothetical protein